MMRLPLLLGPCILLGLVLHAELTQGLVDWKQLPYEDDSFNIQAKFETNVTLGCNDSSLTTAFKFLYWIRPDTTVMEVNETKDFRILDGRAGWEVSDDGMEMTIFTLQESQFGIYYCVGEESGETKVTKRGLNYNGPYFGDLWPEYRMNTIIGLSSAGGFLVMVLIIYLTYHFRFKEEEGGSDVGEGIEERPGVGENPQQSNTNDGPLPTVSATDGSGYVYDNYAYDDVAPDYNDPIFTDGMVHVYDDVAFSKRGFSLQTTEL